MRIFICLLIAASVLCGCGFKLKQANITKEILANAHVTDQNTHIKMNQALKRYLSDLGVVLTNAPGDNIITVLDESLERRLLSLFSNGQVAEYDLIFSIRYSLKTKDKEATIHEYREVRQYQDDPDRALAKFKERAVIIDEMRQKACEAILRRYTAQLSGL